MHIGVKLIFVVVVNTSLPILGVVKLVLLAFYPFCAHFVDLGFVVQFRVVVFAHATHVLPYGEMLGVHGDAVVVLFFSGANVRPATLLLLQVQTRCVREEQPRHKGACETEPWHDVELGLRVDVVVEYRGEEGTGLSDRGREAVSRSADRGGKDFGGDEEGDAVGAELVEERGEEVHSLESVHVLGGGKELEVESRNDEENEIGQEADDHHPFTAIEFVIDEERREVVSAERHANVDQVIQPASHDGTVARRDNFDELVLEELVAVEEDIIGEPRSSRGDKARPEVSECELERLRVIACDVGLALRDHQLFTRRLHLVVTVVNKPKGAHCRYGKRDTVGPLGGELRVRRVAGAVKDEKQNDEDRLVEELSPTLHKEGGRDLSATVKTIVLGRNFAGADGVLHSRSRSHGVFSTHSDAVEK